VSLSRRTVLRATVAGAALTALSPGTARASTPAEGTITDLGPASITNALGNAVFVNGILYAVTRGLSPNAVGVYDPVADRVVRHYDIPTGIGAWAMTAIGTDVYVGTHGPSDLYRINTVTHTVTNVASFGDHFIWNIAASPDGKIYLGTSGTGQMFEYDPATGASRDLGQPAAAELYVRSIAADATTVWAGIGAHAHLVAVDRATGAKRDVLPPELVTRDFVASMTMSETHLAMGISSLGELLVLATANPTDYRIVKATVPGEKYVTATAILGDDVYFAGRPSGTFYRYRRATGQVEALGVPYPEAGTPALLAYDGKVWGIQDGALFVYDPATNAIDYRNLVDRGFRAAPEQPMVIMSDGRRVYVSGKGGVQVHDRATGEQGRIGIPGEPKAMVPVDGQIYMGVYTQALLYGWRPGDASAALLARIANRQDRPRDMVYDADSGLLVIPTQPEPGQPDGALALFHVPTGILDVYRPVIDQQSVYSVTTLRGTAYLGTYIQEGFGLPPATTTARLAGFDLARRRLDWQLEPVPGATFIADLGQTANRIYGVTDNGVLFEFDPARRTVLRTVEVGDAGGDLVVRDDVAYGTDGNRVYRVDLESLRVSTVVDGLAGGWFDGAKLAADPSGRGLYTLQGRNLIHIAIGGPR
jgi:outer membrane protein assembly factor BamB